MLETSEVKFFKNKFRGFLKITEMYFQKDSFCKQYSIGEESYYFYALSTFFVCEIVSSK